MPKSKPEQIRIKLCGMTRPEDAALASALGADAIGLIFYEKSARNVSLRDAREIVRVINPLCATVAVVVNPTEETMAEIIRTLPIQIIQFHGNESAAFCESFNRPYFKVIPMKPGVSLAEKRQEYASASALLLDTYDKQLAGGTGRPFDWSALDDSALAPPKQPDIILAGGLNPQNAQQALKQTGVRNLDVNSGIESAPGVKDHDKMRAMMQIKTNHTL